MSFQKLKIIEPILTALKNEGYITPTSIQEQAIPIILQQKDLFGCARTGTGKTAAFAIPVLQIVHEQKQLSREQHNIKALILTPTRAFIGIWICGNERAIGYLCYRSIE